MASIDPGSPVARKLARRLECEGGKGGSTGAPGPAGAPGCGAGSLATTKASTHDLGMRRGLGAAVAQIAGPSNLVHGALAQQA